MLPFNMVPQARANLEHTLDVEVKDRTSATQELRWVSHQVLDRQLSSGKTRTELFRPQLSPRIKMSVAVLTLARRLQLCFWASSRSG